MNGFTTRRGAGFPVKPPGQIALPRLRPAYGGTFERGSGTDAAPSVAAFAAGFGNVAPVGVLPFHKPGEATWQVLGMPFTLRDVPGPTVEQTGRVRGVFAAHSLHTV